MKKKLMFGKGGGERSMRSVGSEETSANVETSTRTSGTYRRNRSGCAQRTYERIEAKYDHYEAILDDGLAAAATRLMAVNPCRTVPSAARLILSMGTTINQTSAAH